MVVFEGVTKEFAPTPGKPAFKALDAIDYTVPRKAITGIIGRSGAGKSTLIRLVNGLERPTTGRVLVDDTDVASLSGSDLRALRGSVGMIFQHFNLLSSRSVYDNIAMPLEITGMHRTEIAKRVRPLMDLVGLGDKAGNYPAELSGGQKQRVGIARALATRPKLLLSDEATSALDPETTAQILDLLKTINRDLGLTVLLITHEMEVVKEVTSQVAVIDGGRIVEAGRTFDIFMAPSHPTTRTMLSGLSGSALPNWVQRTMADSPRPGDRVITRLVFFGATSNQPLVSRLGPAIGADVNIIAGTIDEIAGEPCGTIVVSHSADPTVVERASQFYRETGLHAEVLGYGP
ncbi:methionine ABC transporter ATP-binding protein [Rhodospirillum sp. A1_3_36]|uniref:methionine ABC transporter ATP-binding protein n=1 Tax=Rhodospirillum sp. A1_3_36 TaxID=3391666 RepID=UPI0039A6A9A7